MNILSKISANSKQLAVLIDPDKSSEEQLIRLSAYANKGCIHLFLVGGSLLLHNRTKIVVDCLKAHCNTPIIIFPGNPSQVDEGADGIFLLSLISGRNPDLLIGRHVESAFMIKNSGLEVIPTGYILIDGGKSTSVSYISNTTPIPSDKPDIVAATALAGELLGLKTIYLEAGSGASNAVPSNVISRVKEAVGIPIIVGGGVKGKQAVKDAFDAGANVVVVGTAIEEDPEWIKTFEEIALSK